MHKPNDTFLYHNYFSVLDIFSERAIFLDAISNKRLVGVSADLVDTGDVQKRVLKASWDEDSPGSYTQIGSQIPFENT